MQRSGTLYTIFFAAIICAIFSVLVAGSAVTLAERQERNALLYKQQNVLSVSGLIEPGKRLTPDEITERYENNIELRIVNLETGEYVDADEVDPATYDQREATKNPETSREPDDNRALVKRVPLYIAVYLVKKDGVLDKIILPVEGMGLWKTLYGFLAVEKDCDTVFGLTFYQHGETPGLGAEVDNKNWKNKWPGRKVYDAEGNVALRVIKGPAPPPEEAPYKVDGLSGATLTCNGVSNLVAFWLSDQGFKPYLEKVRESGGEA
jgi:Na+-transporting NADH:ubiquinone oxidoreductase subunit C